jgi:hypothetical protein
MAAVKRAIYEGASLPHADGLRLERAGFVAAASQPAALDAMRAYGRDLDRVREHPRPWADDEFADPWREGTKVDISGEN